MPARTALRSCGCRKNCVSSQDTGQGNGSGYSPASHLSFWRGSQNGCVVISNHPSHMLSACLGPGNPGNSL